MEMPEFKELVIHYKVINVFPSDSKFCDGHLCAMNFSCFSFGIVSEIKKYIAQQS